MPRPCRTLFLGTDDFSVICLRALFERSKQAGSGISSIEVVTLPKKKKGAKSASAVLEYSLVNNIRRHTWPPLASQMLGRFDTAAVVSFGALLPEFFLDLFPLPPVNVHPSLLPRWRGAAPLAHTVMAGDKETGVTLLQLSKHKFDAGPILMQQAVDVKEDITVGELSNQLATLGSEMLIKCLENYEEHVANAQPQEKGGRWARKISVDMSVIQWQHMTVSEVVRKDRGLSQRYKLRGSWDSVPIRFEGVDKLCGVVGAEADFLPACVPQSPGTMFHRSDSTFLCVRCKDGWIAVDRVAMGREDYKSAEEFAIDILDDLPVQLQDHQDSGNALGTGVDSAVSATDSTTGEVAGDDGDIYYYIGQLDIT